mmetsp:Transcript_13814/g.54762  ORF Transcript_13814/g.54762 Transcript_13814/m.54762 type:complete len:491 (+) Transcript_13814:134-1606(+)
MAMATPLIHAAAAVAPGSGTLFITSAGTYELRPAAATISFVAAAPFSAASAATDAAHAPPALCVIAFDAASAAGSKASSTVLSPSLAPPYRDIDAIPALKPASHVAGDVAGSPFIAAAAAEKKMSYSAPEVPPMLLRTVMPTASASSAGSSRGMYATSSSSARAPLACVAPQSPSPTLASASVSSSSAIFSISAAPKMAFFASAPISVRGGSGLSPRRRYEAFAAATGSSSSPSGLEGTGIGTETVRATTGQAGAPVGASILASLALSAWHSVTENPVMSSAVMNDPTYTRTGLRSCASSHSRAALAATCSSISGVDPSELTMTHTFVFSSPSSDLRRGGSRSRHLMYPRSSSTIVSSILATTLATGAARDVNAPGSPWIPRPISSSPGGIALAGSSAPGIACAADATPMVPTAQLAARASSATRSSVSPAAAAAPAHLCTKRVPASPRRPATPRGGGSAQSSATTTISTLRPSSLARSAARPKLSLSPV